MEVNKLTQTIEIPEGIKAILFDCDGTLADTLSAHWKAWQDLLEEYMAEVPLDFLIKFNGMPTEFIVEQINQSFGLTLPVNEFSARKDLLVTSQLTTTVPIKPVVELARSQYGKKAMGVVSGGLRVNVEATLNAIDCLHLFDHIICADDDFLSKYQPECFLNLAKLFGVEPEECVLLEDADLPMQSAKKAGMHVIDVRIFLS